MPLNPGKWDYTTKQPAQTFLGRYFARQQSSRPPVTKLQQRQLQALQDQEEKNAQDEHESLMRQTQGYAPRKMWSETPYQYRMLLNTWRAVHIGSAEDKLFRALEQKYLTGPIGGPMDAHARVSFEDNLERIDKKPSARAYRGRK